MANWKEPLLRISENGIIQRITRALVTGILAVFAGAVAYIVCFILALFSTHASRPIESAVLFSLGIPISASVGVLFGMLRGAPLNPIVLLVGWFISLPLCPSAQFVIALIKATGYVMIMLELTILIALAGPLGAIIATKNDRRKLRNFTVAIVLVTVGFTLLFMKSYPEGLI